MRAKDNIQAFADASEEFKRECFIDGTDYVPIGKDLLSGLTFESLQRASPRMFESLVIELVSLDREKLKEWYLAAFRAGHKDHLYLHGMGHVHRSMILLLTHKATKYFDSL